MVTDTTNDTPRPIAGSCHLANLLAWSQRHCLSIPNVSCKLLQPFFCTGWAVSRQCEIPRQFVAHLPMLSVTHILPVLAVSVNTTSALSASRQGPCRPVFKKIACLVGRLGSRPRLIGLFPCGETQTMSHIVESCPLTKLNGGLSRLHSADEDAVSWLTSYGSWNAYEKKIGRIGWGVRVSASFKKCQTRGSVRVRTPSSGRHGQCGAGRQGRWTR